MNLFHPSIFLTRHWSAWPAARRAAIVAAGCRTWPMYAFTYVHDLFQCHDALKHGTGNYAAAPLVSLRWSRTRNCHVRTRTRNLTDHRAGKIEFFPARRHFYPSRASGRAVFSNTANVHAHKSQSVYTDDSGTLRALGRVSATIIELQLCNYFYLTFPLIPHECSGRLLHIIW